MVKKLIYVSCETCEDWHIITTKGLNESCVIICGHTIKAGKHHKIPSEFEDDE